MRKILLFTALLVCAFISKAQIVDEKDKVISEQLVRANKDALRLTSEEANNLIVHTAYQIPNSDIRMAYMQQSYKSIPVYNKLLVLAFKNGRLVSQSGDIIHNIDDLAQKHNGLPTVDVAAAFATALANREVGLQTSIPAAVKDENSRINFGRMGIFSYDATAELMWYPMEFSNDKGLRLVWQFLIAPQKSSDTWLVRVDANTNTVVGISNLTVYCDWDNKPHTAQEHMEKKHFRISAENIFVLNKEEHRNWNYKPYLVNNATYRVIKYPAESPNHPGGTPQTHTNPWTWAPGNATSLGWHTSDNANFYDSTRGNNVFAYEDRDANNIVGLSAVSTTAQPDLTFDFAPDFTVAPTQRTPVPNQQFNTTNLFYWNNLIHDVSYLYGFNEAARNFQTNNQGRGGAGNDPVLAEAQDGSGTNNANFATPADGGSGRMQMYLWTSTTPQRDGDVDNGIILHEHTHGISNRLTGTGSGCLGNNEQMGEGWSDYYALMLTQDWTTSLPTDGFAKPRGMGTYALGQATTGVGIRPTQYTTNMAINPTTYSSIGGLAIPHGVGYAWCTMLWDMTWEIIQTNGISPNIFDPTATGGNVIALKLVQEGMRLQPCNPGFVDGRNAILKADTLFYGAQYSCSILKAFARRGLGRSASQGSSGSTTDGVAAFDGGEPIVSLTVNFPLRPELSTAAYTNTVTNGCDPIDNFTLTDTLPAHVTYVSGGIYDPINRVVSFPITLAPTAVQTYPFSVTINAGSYFPPVIRVNENADAVVAPALPAGWTATTTNAAAFWRSVTTSFRSAPNAFFVNNLATPSDVSLTTTIARSGPIEGWGVLSFWHRWTTEAGFDGGRVEVSTDGGATWLDVEPYILQGGYTGATPNGRGWTGSQATFIQTRINLTPFSGGDLMIRFRFGSDVTVGSTGWWVDDITLDDKPVVVMKSNLYDDSFTRTKGATNVVEIVNTCPVAITVQPVARIICEGASTTFSVTAPGALTYQWQLSTDVGATWNNIPGATASSVAVSNVVLSQSGHQYRVVILTNCGVTETSNAVTLDVTPNPSHVNLGATPNPVCQPGPVTLTGTAIGGTLSGGSNVVIASSGVLNLPIPDGGAPLTNNITLPAFTFNTAASLKIRLNISHTYVGDLVVRLTTPCGNTIVFDRPGVPATAAGNSADLNGIYIFDLGAATVIPETLGATPVPPGNYLPSDANGTSHTWAGLTFPCTGAGTWTLSVQDNAAIDAGSLIEWAIMSTSPVSTYTHTLTGPGTIVQNASTGGPSNPTANFTASNIPAGTLTYNLTTADSRGCSVTSPINVTVNPKPSPLIASPNPQTVVFTSSGGTISIPGTGTTGNAAPYPSTITTSGLPANAQVASVTLNGLSHAFPGDIDIVLQSPNGTNVILMSDVGGTNDIVNVNYTLVDGAPALGTGLNGSGTYSPTNITTPDNFPAPGPGSISQAAPTLASFTPGLTPNGDWKLFAVDDASGDVGSLTGWSITFSYPGVDLCAGSSTLLTILDTVKTITSSVPITIPDMGNGTPYPATLAVSGLTPYARVRSVTINGLSHTTIGDVDVLLQSPNGTNVILMSDRGGNNPVSNVNYTFQDGFPLLGTAGSPSGTYAPTNTAGPDVFPAPGPGSITQVNPTIATFNTLSLVVNGTWNLYVVDQNPGDQGSITSWSITFDVPGATTITYTWSPATGLSSTTGNPVTASPTTTTTYTVTAVTSFGCATSAPATVKVNVLGLPAITAQPAPATQTICPGYNVSYSVTATGAGLTYQWKKNGVNMVNGGNVSGATSSTLTLTNVSAADAATYTVVVTGSCPPAVTSNGAVLQIGTAPTITTQPPATRTICERQSTTLSVVATALPPVQIYQWQVSTNNGTTWTNLANSAAGASPFYNNVFTATLTIANAPLSISNNQYRVIITTNCGFTITSSATVVTVSTTPAVTAVPVTARICLSDTLVILNGSPAGGVWSGPGVVPGTNQFLPFNTSIGTFTVKYKITSIPSGCADSALVNIKVEDCAERIRLLRNDGVLLYPNPNSGQFNIRINSTLYNYLGMKVFTNAGALVKQQKWTNLPYGRVLPIDLRHLAAGVYMVYVYYEDGVRTSEKTFKVIIPSH